MSNRLLASPRPNVRIRQLSEIVGRQQLSDAAPIWAQLTFTAIGQCASPEQAHTLRNFLPYGLVRVPGSTTRCVINRAYHAVGTVTWTRYESATPWHLSLAQYRALRCAGVVDDEGFLFDDRTSPWRSAESLDAYRERIAGLLGPWLVAGVGAQR